MTRRAVWGILAILLSWQISQPVFAQAKAKAKAKRSVVSRAVQWEKLPDGVEVLRLFGTRLRMDEPEVAILRLTPPLREAFNANPKQFILDHPIFTRPINNATRVHVWTPPPAPLDRSKLPETAPVKKGVDPWYEILEHMPTSDVYYMESQFNGA